MLRDTSAVTGWYCDLSSKRDAAGKKAAPPGDPFAYVMVPVKRGPVDGVGQRWRRLKRIRIRAFLRADKARRG